MGACIAEEGVCLAGEGRHAWLGRGACMAREGACMAGEVVRLWNGKVLGAYQMAGF